MSTQPSKGISTEHKGKGIDNRSADISIIANTKKTPVLMGMISACCRCRRLREKELRIPPLEESFNRSSKFQGEVNPSKYCRRIEPEPHICEKPQLFFKTLAMVDLDGGGDEDDDEHDDDGENLNPIWPSGARICLIRDLGRNLRAMRKPDVTVRRIVVQTNSSCRNFIKQSTMREATSDIISSLSTIVKNLKVFLSFEVI
ncbi:hypothetical protein LguiB_001390 [Lonicera macranthoides]